MGEGAYLEAIVAHTDALRDRFAVTGQRAQVGFAAMQAQRLFPLYRTWAGENTLSAQMISRGIDAVWRWLESLETPEPNLRERCFELTPDTDDDPEEISHAASNAGAAVVGAIDLIDEPNPERAASIGGLVVELYDAYAGEDATLKELTRQQDQAEQAIGLMSGSIAVPQLRAQSADEVLAWSSGGLRP